MSILRPWGEPDECCLTHHYTCENLQCFLIEKYSEERETRMMDKNSAKAKREKLQKLQKGASGHSRLGHWIKLFYCQRLKTGFEKIERRPVSVEIRDFLKKKYGKRKMSTFKIFDSLNK